MPDKTTVDTTIKVCNNEKVTTETVDQITTTTTNNCSKTSNQTKTVAPDTTMNSSCPCGHFDLDQFAEESRRCAFKSSNIALATSNSILVFTMLILQEILKNQCRSHHLNLDQVFLITSAIAALGDGVQINNPQPFNS